MTVALNDNASLFALFLFERNFYLIYSPFYRVGERLNEVVNICVVPSMADIAAVIRCALPLHPQLALGIKFAQFIFD